MEFFGLLLCVFVLASLIAPWTVWARLRHMRAELNADINLLRERVSQLEMAEKNRPRASAAAPSAEPAPMIASAPQTTAAVAPKPFVAPAPPESSPKPPAVASATAGLKPVADEPERSFAVAAPAPPPFVAPTPSADDRRGAFATPASDSSGRDAAQEGRAASNFVWAPAG